MPASPLLRKPGLLAFLLTAAVSAQTPATPSATDASAPIDAFKRFEKILRQGDTRSFDKPGRNEADLRKRMFEQMEERMKKDAAPANPPPASDNKKTPSS